MTLTSEQIEEFRGRVCRIYPDGLIDAICDLALDGLRLRPIHRAASAAPEQPPQMSEPVRTCTCHPDDNPPVPCPQKYALSECRIAALRAELDAANAALRDADVDIISYVAYEDNWRRKHAAAVERAKKAT